MPTIYDNVETPFQENDAGNGLKDALKVSQRGDFCVGYFNLRGWKAIDQVVASWPKMETPPCRLLVGMQRLPQEELSLLVDQTKSPEERITNKRVAQLKRKIANEFQKQLTIGTPTPADEAKEDENRPDYKDAQPPGHRQKANSYR